MTLKETDLYAPVLDLFGENYSVACDVQLGPKRIDIVLTSKEMNKIIAIEVKISKWKQAIRQALNYQLAADESYVAILKKHTNAINMETFKQLGIGLITIDSDGQASVKIPAKLSSRKQKNYSTLVRAFAAEQQSAANPHPVHKAFQTPAFKNYLWYVANEREYYSEFTDCYDGFFINAHILEHFASAFSALSLALQKPFFIIPDTHFFQIAPITYFFDTKGLIKSSWEKLIDSYGPFIRFVINQGRNLQVDDFISRSGAFQQALYDLVQRVIASQKGRVASAVQGLSRFFDSEPEPTPTYLVAPYFFFASIEDPWYKISLEMAKQAVKQKGTHELYILLCTSKSVLMSDNAVSTIVNDFSGLDIAGFLIWIQDFNEAEEPSPLLYKLRQFVIRLSQNGRNVINTHGSFFSSLLCYSGLNGVGFGLCYKEFSDPEAFPSGGPPGGPVPKYYIPRIKFKLGKVEAAIALNEVPSLSCSCSICSEREGEMLDAATPDRVSKDLMKRHFMICKRSERDYVCRASFSDILNDLNSTYDLYRNDVHIIPIEHLKRWVESSQ